MKKEKLLTLFLALFLTIASGYAQVTVGSLNDPNVNALLDLQQGPANKALLLPHVTLTSLQDIASFNNTPAGTLKAGTMVYNTGTATLVKGVYFWNGTAWQSAFTNWFYMPSIPLDVAYTGTGTDVKTPVDLYALYATQFTGATKSPAAPAIGTQIPFPGPTNFYYYVVGYDTSVFTAVSINDNGVLQYSLQADATDATYMNIIFVPKN